jgi:hypothetical protein
MLSRASAIRSLTSLDTDCFRSLASSLIAEASSGVTLNMTVSVLLFMYYKVGQNVLQVNGFVIHSSMKWHLVIQICSTKGEM